MSQGVGSTNPVPPPSPKIIFFVELITLIGVGYLIYLATKAEDQSGNLNRGFNKGERSGGF